MDSKDNMEIRKAKGVAGRKQNLQRPVTSMHDRPPLEERKPKKKNKRDLLAELYKKLQQNFSRARGIKDLNKILDLLEKKLEELDISERYRDEIIALIGTAYNASGKAGEIDFNVWKSEREKQRGSFLKLKESTSKKALANAIKLHGAYVSTIFREIHGIKLARVREGRQGSLTEEELSRIGKATKAFLNKWVDEVGLQVPEPSNFLLNIVINNLRIYLNLNEEELGKVKKFLLTKEVEGEKIISHRIHELALPEEESKLDISYIGGSKLNLSSSSAAQEDSLRAAAILYSIGFSLEDIAEMLSDKSTIKLLESLPHEQLPYAHEAEPSMEDVDKLARKILSQPEEECKSIEEELANVALTTEESYAIEEKEPELYGEFCKAMSLYKKLRKVNLSLEKGIAETEKRMVNNIERLKDYVEKALDQERGMGINEAETIERNMEKMARFSAKLRQVKLMRIKILALQFEMGLRATNIGLRYMIALNRKHIDRFGSIIFMLTQIPEELKEIKNTIKRDSKNNEVAIMYSNILNQGNRFVSSNSWMSQLSGKASLVFNIYYDWIGNDFDFLRKTKSNVNVKD